MSKKGMLTQTQIVVMVLAVILLVVVIVMLTGGFEKIKEAMSKLFWFIS